MAWRSSFALASSIALSGCSLFHSNINGAFTCAAPRGTCAPSMAIDDTALRAIGPGSGDQAEDAAMPASGAGPGHLARARKHASQGEDSREPMLGARPALKVVYPAWRGADGRVHERSVAYAPVDMPAMIPAQPQPIEAGTVSASEPSSLLAVAEMAPEADAPANPPPVAQVSAGAPWQEGAPKAAPVPAAANPMDAIKQQVSQILSSLPKPDPTKGRDAPAPRAGSSFPPAGN